MYPFLMPPTKLSDFNQSWETRAEAWTRIIYLDHIGAPAFSIWCWPSALTASHHVSVLMKSHSVDRLIPPGVEECFQSNIKVCVWQTDILTSYWKAQCFFFSTLCFISLFHSVWNAFLNLHLLQDLHSGLEIKSCCIWHQDFLFILRLSHL